MPKPIVCHFRIVLDNPKAVRALQAAADALLEVGDDMPWRPELKRAAKALRYAAKHLKGERVRR